MDVLSTIMTLVILIMTMVFLYVSYSSREYGYFKKAGIPSLTPIPALGNTHQVMKLGLFEFHFQYYKKFVGEKVYGFFSSSKPILVVRDLDMIRDIMVKNFNSFANRRILFSPKPLNKMTAQLKDEEWRYVRNTIRPTLSTGKLCRMSKHVEMNVDNLMSSLRESCKNQEDIELTKIMGCFTLDVIASTGFGVMIDSIKDKSSNFHKQAKAFFNSDRKALVLRSIFPFAFKLMDKLGIILFYKEQIAYFSSFIDAVKEKRINNQDGTGSKPNDFIQLLINEEMKQQQARKKNAGNGQQEHEFQGLNYEQVQGQALSFLHAGFGPVTSVLSYALFALANNTEICANLHKEIDRVLEGNVLNHETINSLHYLDMCLNEVMRMWPPGFMVDRTCTEDCIVQGIKMNKGLTIIIPIMQIHYDPQYYPEPEKFNPERFSNDNKESRHPYAHLPFSAGPRNCIGMRLAMLELKMALAAILQEMTPVPCEMTVYPPKLNRYELKAEDGLWVKFVSRKK